MMKSDHQDECVLCCSEIKIYASGACDHPVCCECSTRMRVLCETNECPICRSDMPVVVFTHKQELFDDVYKKFTLLNKEYHIIFQDEIVLYAFERLLQNRCKVCEDVLPNFDKLKSHMSRTHELHYCQLCTDSVKIFTFERKCYTRKDLARHKRAGDPDEKSHRGHPLCEFCDIRFPDDDDLYRHLRRDHFYCHFCDADGLNQYYADCDDLQVHFRRDHYLCEDGDCSTERFTCAFRTPIDLKAHTAMYHMKNKSKAEAKQIRTLDFEFACAPYIRPTGNSSPRGRRYGARQRNDDESNSRDNKPAQPLEVEKINTESVKDFPYLSEDGTGNTTLANKPGAVAKLTSLNLTSYNRNPIAYQRGNMMSVEDFPALSTTAAPPDIPGRQPNTSNSSNGVLKNAPVRTSNHATKSKILLSYSAASDDKTLTNGEKVPKKMPKWIAKQGNFEEEFPTLKVKNLPSVATQPPTSVLKAAFSIPPSDSIALTKSASGDQFVVIKNKSKKKNRQNKMAAIADLNNDETASIPPSDNKFNTLEDDEYMDPFKKHMVHPLARTALPAASINSNWYQEVSFGTDDFPALAPSKPKKAPPGFQNPKPKPPPPKLNAATHAEVKTDTGSNKTLSSMIREIMMPSELSNGVNKTHSSYSPNEEVKQPEFIKLHDFDWRNKELVERIQEILKDRGPQFEEFKGVSQQFRFGAISTNEYHAKCLQILGESGFLAVFSDLVSLLPNIKKQQELLTIHNRFLSQKKRGVLSKNTIELNSLLSCDKCNQVLVDQDSASHARHHSQENYQG